MKTAFLSLIAITFTLSAHSQSYRYEDDIVSTDDKFDEVRYGLLQKTTVIFFYSKWMEKDTDDYKDAIGRAWNITPVEFKPIEQYKEYFTKPQYSYLMINKTVVHYTNPGGTDILFDLDLMMWGPKYLKTKKPRTELLQMAQLPLFADSATTFAQYKKDEDEIISYYTNGHFYNFNPGMVKCMVGSINNIYKKKQFLNIGGPKDYSDNAQISKLRSAVLYLPQSITIRANILNGKQTIRPQYATELLKNYAYKYLILPEDKLSESLMKETITIYVLIYTRQSNNNIIMIYNNQSNDLMFYRNTRGAQLTAKDFAGIVK